MNRPFLIAAFLGSLLLSTGLSSAYEGSKIRFEFGVSVSEQAPPDEHILIETVLGQTTDWSKNRTVQIEIGAKPNVYSQRITYNNSDSRAITKLLSVMRPQPMVNASAIVTKSAGPELPTQQLKLEQEQKGRTRWTVLAPLSMQGYQMLETDSRFTVYNPDSKTLTVQEMSEKTDDSKQRIDLALQNYQIRFGQTVQIAGRKAVCVQAIPYNPSMAQRNYYIDAQEPFLLRLEIVESSKRRWVVRDTLSVRYVEKFQSNVFQILTASDVRTLSDPGLARVTPQRAAVLFGSPLILPARFPAGFVLDGIEIPVGCTEGECENVTIRLSDGLVKATIYQYNEGKVQRSSKPGPTNIAIYSDMPLSAEQRIMNAFISAAGNQPVNPVYSARNRSPLRYGVQCCALPPMLGPEPYLDPIFFAPMLEPTSTGLRFP